MTPPKGTPTCKRCGVKKTPENTYVIKKTNRFSTYCTECNMKRQQEYRIKGKRNRARNPDAKSTLSLKNAETQIKERSSSHMVAAAAARMNDNPNLYIRFLENV